MGTRGKHSCIKESVRRDSQVKTVLGSLLGLAYRPSKIRMRAVKLGVRSFIETMGIRSHRTRNHGLPNTIPL